MPCVLEVAGAMPDSLKQWKLHVKFGGQFDKEQTGKHAPAWVSGDAACAAPDMDMLLVGIMSMQLQLQGQSYLISSNNTA